jgi:hypothetical protein
MSTLEETPPPMGLPPPVDRDDLGMEPTIMAITWISVPPGTLVGLLSRLSVTILLIHFFPPYRWFTYYLITFTGLMWIAGILLSL